MKRFLKPCLSLFPHSAAQQLSSSASLCFMHRYVGLESSDDLPSSHSEHFGSSQSSSNSLPLDCTASPPVTRSQSPSPALKWVQLPAVPPNDGIAGVLNKELTAVRWVRKCCPELSNSLIEKLFRLRQIRICLLESQSHETRRSQFQRVRRESLVVEGTVLCLPRSVLLGMDKAESGLKTEGLGDTEQKYELTVDELDWIRNLVLHMDEHVIAINKPPGLAVQGGVGITMSLDAVLGPALSFTCQYCPKLAHRLDKETSGVIVLGRTKESTALLHALFREKTASATSGCKPIVSHDRVIERRYWALVIGILKKKSGRISAPLRKVVLDGGKSEIIVISENGGAEDVTEAITDYYVLGPSVFGCTWIELHPLTGRKHQLRVHCAEVLGMPIVGDYKYGRQVHDNWARKHGGQSGVMENNFSKSEMRNTVNAHSKTANGSVTSKKPLLHLHSRMLTIPEVKELSTKQLLLDPHMGKKAFINRLCLSAPLPPHMKASWDLLPPSGENGRKEVEADCEG